jgi:hypothetical protein
MAYAASDDSEQRRLFLLDTSRDREASRAKLVVDFPKRAFPRLPTNDRRQEETHQEEDRGGDLAVMKKRQTGYVLCAPASPAFHCQFDTCL